jgi:hypothetical protein
MLGKKLNLRFLRGVFGGAVKELLRGEKFEAFLHPFEVYVLHQLWLERESDLLQADAIEHGLDQWEQCINRAHQIPVAAQTGQTTVLFRFFQKFYQ